MFLEYQRPFGYQGISILASASTFKYKNCPLILHIFAKHVIFSKVATYRLKAYNFVRKGMQRYLAKNFQKFQEELS